jgi:hypothetical protein
MFLSYIDASGRPYGDEENFVLATIISNEEDWQKIDNGVKLIKLKHFPSLPDEDIEFHAKDMVNHKGLFKQLPWNYIYSIIDDIFDLISQTDIELRIIGVLIDKKRLRRSIDIEIWAYRLLFERINKFLERKNTLLMSKQHPPQYCIMIMDSEGETKDRKLRKRLLTILRHGTLYSQLQYLIEDPLFTDSKWRNLLQLVDVVAYCIRKKYRANTTSFQTQKWESFYAKMEPKLDSPFGSYHGHGLKIFP